MDYPNRILKAFFLFLFFSFSFFHFEIPFSYSQSSAGIGVILQYVPDHKTTKIRAVFKGSPAAKAQIRPGDEVLSVDGVSTENLSFEEIGKKILGVPGTSIALRLRSSHGIREVKLIRSNPQKLSPLIVDSSSKSSVLTFAERNELKEIVRRLKTQEDQRRLEKLMIDFRDRKISKEEFFKKIRNEF